jgi:ribosome-binding factor A
MTHPGKRQGPTQRQLRVGELIRHVIAELLTRGDIDDPALQANPVTVSEVRPSPDLKSAIVYVIPLGGEGADEVVGAMERHRRFIRGELGKRVTLKYMPELRFKIDTSFESSRRIDELLHSPEVSRDLKSK